MLKQYEFNERNHGKHKLKFSFVLRKQWKQDCEKDKNPRERIVMKERWDFLVSVFKGIPPLDLFKLKCKSVSV